MAETVGSIMGNHCGKGRVLTPENFSDELYLGAPPPCTSTLHLHPAPPPRHREVYFMICDRALDRCFRGKWMKSRDFWVHISASAKQGMERLCKGRRSRFRRVVRLPCLQQAAEAAANHLQNEYLKLLSMLLCFHARDVCSSKVFEGLTGSWLKHLPLLFIIRILQVKTNAVQCNAMQCNRQQSH